MDGSERNQGGGASVLDPARTLERARCGLIRRARTARAHSRAAPRRVVAMTERLSAVLVRDEAGPLGGVSKILPKKSIETRQRGSTPEIPPLLRGGSPPGGHFPAPV